MTITAETVRELFVYCPETGILTNRITRSSRAQIGNEAGGVGGFIGSFYRQVMIEGRKYKTHRIIFLYMTRSLPTNQVDHINGDTFDNRWVNLRDVTKAENMQNAKIPRNNTSGHIGVCWHKRCKKWAAQISVAGEKTCLGYFTDKQDAINARNAAEIEYGYHPNHGRSE